MKPEGEKKGIVRKRQILPMPFICGVCVPVCVHVHNTRVRVGTSGGRKRTRRKADKRRE